MITSPFNKPNIIPPNEHPRLMFRKADIPRIKENLELEESKFALIHWKELIGMRLSDFDEAIKSGLYNLRICMCIEAKALQAVLEDDKALANEVIDAITLVLDNYDKDKYDIMKARFGGHVVFLTAQIYDWLYDCLSDEKKQYLINKCETILSETLEMGYPPAKQTPIAGHGTEAQLLRDTLALGIAVYDERPDIYDFCAGRIIDEYIPTYEYFFKGRFQLQGPAYGAYRYCYAAFCQLLFMSMGCGKVFDENFEDTAESFLQLIRGDGELMRLGDDFYESKCVETRYPYSMTAPLTVPMFFAGAMTGKSIYRNYHFDNYRREYFMPEKLGRDYYIDGSYGEGTFTPALYMIWNRLTPVAECEAPAKAIYYGHPAGVTVYNDRDTKTCVVMKIGEMWTGGHDHYDGGHFEIYCDGMLTGDSGYYNWFGCEHHYNYLLRTTAHNCVTISEPDKVGTDVEIWWRKDPNPKYDGGQIVIDNSREPQTEQELKTIYQRGVVTSHIETDEKIELSGNLTKNYEDRVNSYVRDMCFLPKDGQKGKFVVEDTIALKDKSYITQLHLHAYSEPEVEGNMIIMHNGKTKLVCTIVEPKQFNVEVIGGEGKEFMLAGENHPYPLLKGKEDYNESGWGRVTITDNTDSNNKKFRIEMEICQDN